MVDKKANAGAITVEAAIVMPIFICIIISLAMLIKLVYVHDVVQHALDESANELATYAYMYKISSLQEIDDTVQDNLGQGAVLVEGHIDTVVRAYEDLEEAAKLTGSIREIAVDLDDSDAGFVEQAEDIISHSRDTFLKGQQLTKQNIENIKALQAAFEEACKDPQKEVKSLVWMLSKGLYSDVKTILAVPIVKYTVCKYIAPGSGGYAGVDARLKKLNVYNGLDGMDFYSSTFFDGDENIDIIVKYKVELPLSIKLLPDIYMLQRSTSRAWLAGGDGTEVQKSNIWDLPNLQRGVKIEEMYGGNLPFKFPVIDRYDADSKTGTSIKSINLNSETYQNESVLSKTLMGYVDHLKNSSTLIYEKQSYELVHKKLIIVVPKNSVNENKQIILNQILSYAAKHNIEASIEEL